MLKRIRKLEGNARFLVRRGLLDSFALAGLYRSVRPAYADEGRLDASKSIIMDGFPRSGNSYARFAFLVAQHDAVEFGGHAHSSQLLIQGLKMGKPVVLLVRDPFDVVGSLVQFECGLSPVCAFWAYAHYHSKALPYVRDMIVSTFERTTGDFGSIIEDVNCRWGSRFLPYVKNVENEQEVMRRIGESDARFNHGKRNEASIARPSSSRLPASVVLAGMSTRCERAYAEAMDVYRAVLETQ